MAQAEKVSGGLEISENRDWQEKFWTAQRIAWVLMGLFILAALAGLTGKGGPLSRAKADLGGATLEYPRIARWQTDEKITVRVAPSAPEKVELLLSPKFVELFSINSIEPEPTEVMATARGHLFAFDSPGSGERVIVLNGRATNPVFEQKVGASIGKAPPARLTFTVLP